MRVIIAGGGIGGLTLAIALRRRNLEAIVLERAPELGFVGAGITMQPNAMRAFASLGIDGEIASEGEVVRNTQLLDSTGRVLSELALDRIEAKAGAKMVCIHRARLQSVLLRHAGEVKLGKSVRAYRESEGGVSVELDDGSSERGDLMVGADGLRSAVRRQMRGDEPLRYSGHTSWRGVAKSSVPAGVVSESWGRGERFGIVPIGHGEVYWFAVADAPAGGTEAHQRELARRFGRWHDPIARLLDATDADHILRTDIYDRPPIGCWSAGRAILLGDAAHPVTPNLGQGGCQAIEDAVVLAACLARDPVGTGAIAEYEGARVARANRVVDRARSFGAWAQSSGSVATRLRDALVRATPRALVERQMLAFMRFEPRD